MARIVPVRAMTGGITQQPALLAAPDKLEDSLNVIPLPETGLSDRGPSQWRVKHGAIPVAKSGFIPINFGGDDRYLAVVQQGEIKVYLRNGVEIPVVASDFDYIDFRRRQLLLNAELLNTAATAGVWTLDAGGVMQNPTYPETTRSPLGFPDQGAAAANQGYYANLRADGTVGAIGEIQQVVAGYLWSGIRSVALYINPDGAVPLADDVGLILEDPTEGTVFRVRWSFGGTFTSAPTVISNTNNFVTFTETLPATQGAGDHYRLGFIFDPTKVAAPVGPGNTIQVRVELTDLGGVLSNMQAWGCLLGFDHKRTELPEYTEPPEVLRTVDAAGTTFIANPLEPTRMDTTVTSRTFAEVYGTLDFDSTPDNPGHPTTTNHPVADAGYIHVRLGQDAILTTNTEFNAAVKVTDGTTTQTIPVNITTPTLGATDGTHDIAQHIADAINNNTAAGQNRADQYQIVEAFAVGSVVQLLTKDDTGNSKTWVIAEIITWDSAGDQAMSAFTDQVDDITDLPLTCQDDHVVKVLETADDASNRDDYQVPQLVLRFEAEDPVANNPTTSQLAKGRWVEGTDYGVRTTLDASTLPHTLVRKVDDTVGTTTGQARQVYFDFGPHTWDDRVIGDDVSNPFPGFTTPEADEGVADRYVGGISFYRNRLMLGSGLYVDGSEAFLYGNFFRTSLKALADSDRVSVVASTPDASAITDMVTAAGRLFLRSDRSILAVTQSTVFGPRSVGLDSVFGDGTGPLAAAAPAAGGLFVPGDGDDHGGIVFLVRRRGETVGDTEFLLEDFDVSAEVSRLLNRDIATLTWAGALKSLYVHSRSDLTKFYGLRFDISRQVPQVSWYPCDMDGSDIHSLAAIAGDLFILVERGDGLHIESIPLDEFQRDGTQEWRVRLDRRVTEQDLTTPMTFAGSETSITLPYTPRSGATVMVCHRDGTDFGVALTVTDVTGAVVKVSGDHTGDQLFIGETYDRDIRALRPVLRNDDGSPISDIICVRDGEVMFAESGYGQVVVVEPTGTERAVTEDKETASAVTLADFRVPFTVGTAAEDADVRVRNSTQKPMNLVGMEWRVDVEESGERGG